ncbi:mitogen-activated protein kinase kinase 9-like [Gastrolobium bilobum]|uniref:mitogen-activated protein kinase kinase 9-like n=1 Tax=Gastrolobium bilobum TaxID=150636 RepID=UPI002AB046F0|nr:mitogen-activated protein kinase kinase 9-like [Gastrolobium bilobum]
MAIVRPRLNFNLHLKLPETSEIRPCFTLPILPITTKSSGGDAIALDDVEKLAVLGHGSGGTVYKVRHKKTCVIYALKVIHCESDAAARSRVISEINILAAADCPYIVRYHGSSVQPFGDVSIVMEYMDSGTLETALKSGGAFSERRLSAVARDVLNGIAYIHARNVAHRDLKPANILMNSNNEIKIADFGVSKQHVSAFTCNTFVGTCAYMSPERLNPNGDGGNYNGYAADIWSFGLTLFELYVGHYPFLHPGQTPTWTNLIFAICFSDPPSLPETASPEFRSFMECCLNKESGERWTATQLLTHPFVFVCQDPETC